jgi:hypothetical protein
MAYVLKKSTGGGGGGTATDTLQTIQINQINELSSTPSVFKTPSDKSVFTENSHDLSTFNDDSEESLLYKSLVSDYNGTIRINKMYFIVFTAVTAVAVASLVDTWLASTKAIIVSVTSSQGAGSHDIFIMYSQ